MASRVELKAALERLRGQPSFDTYVHTLWRAREDVISRLLAKTTTSSQWAELIAEARVYDDLLSTIKNNT